MPRLLHPTATVAPGRTGKAGAIRAICRATEPEGSARGRETGVWRIRPI